MVGGEAIGAVVGRRRQIERRAIVDFRRWRSCDNRRDEIIVDNGSHHGADDDGLASSRRSQSDLELLVRFDQLIAGHGDFDGFRGFVSGKGHRARGENAVDKVVRSGWMCAHASHGVRDVGCAAQVSVASDFEREDRGSCVAFGLLGVQRTDRHDAVDPASRRLEHRVRVGIADAARAVRDALHRVFGRTAATGFAHRLLSGIQQRQQTAVVGCAFGRLVHNRVDQTLDSHRRVGGEVGSTA